MAIPLAKTSTTTKAAIITIILLSILLFCGLTGEALDIFSRSLVAVKQARWNLTSLQGDNTAEHIGVQQHVVSNSDSDGLHIVPGGVLGGSISKVDFGNGDAIAKYFQALEQTIALRETGVVKVAEFEKSPTPANLSERGLLPKSTFKKSKEKGQGLLCWLDNPAAAKKKGVSTWTEVDMLKQWGWVLEKGAADYNHMRSVLGREFQEISFDNGIKMIWEHVHDATIGGVTYKATNANYHNVYWPDKGIILAISNYNPEYKIQVGAASVEPWKDDKGKPLPIVKLKQWSDMAFLTWKSLTTTDQRANLRWVFRRNIMNAQTLQMISDVVAKSPGGKEAKETTRSGVTIKQAPTFPGVVVKPGDDGHTAMAGTPNAGGVAWLLIQHQSDMGHKTIGRIWLFDEDIKGLGYSPSIIMEIVEAKEVLYEGT